MQKTVFFVDFYSPGPLSIRPLQNALEARGYTVKLIALKKHYFDKPKKVTETEFNLLIDFIKKEQPVLVGICMTTSYYCELYKAVTDRVKELNIRMVGGGIFASSCPEKCLEYTEYIVRGEGEEPICELADALYNKQDPAGIKNLSYINESGEVVLNPMRPLITDMDKNGPARVGTGSEYVIEQDKLINYDQQTKEFAYSINASRGCYFMCSFCGSSTMRKISKGCGGYVRLRKVECVVDELRGVMKKMKNLVYVRFVDPVFPTNAAWVDEFCKQYKEKVNLPFKIWTHPNTTDPETIRKLRKAGLFKAIMGIQSGSPTIRKEIYKRRETQEDIIKAARAFYEYKIPQVEYDLILCHPFETDETIKESYDLLMALPGKYSINMNGLKFLPQTEIVDIAIERGIATKEELEEDFYAPVDEQYDYFNLAKYSQNHSPEMNFWYKMIYLAQFSSLHRVSRKIASDPKKYAAKLNKTYKRAIWMKKLRRYSQLAGMLLLGMRVRLFVR